MSLPPLYARWVTSLLQAEVPGESKATCDNCVMCNHTPEKPSTAVLYFNPLTKCCTYQPELYNFLVGRILLDNDPALAYGRESLEKRFDDNITVSPFGVGQAPSYTLAYTENAPEKFGRDEGMVCPHYIYEGGLCGIWQHRNAVCATWYCKHERGAVGINFWRTLHQLLYTIELQLCHWCVLQLDIGVEALQILFPLLYNNRQTNQPTGRQAPLLFTTDPKVLKKAWGKWVGREREFFIECANLVNALSWEDVTSICGADLKAYSELLRAAYQKLGSTEIAEFLKAGEVATVQVEEGYLQVQAYSPYDALRMPAKVAQILPYFSGRSVNEALEEIRVKERIKVSPGLVRRLSDFGILVPDED